MGNTKSGLSVEAADSPYYVYSLLMKNWKEAKKKKKNKNPTIPKT